MYLFRSPQFKQTPLLTCLPFAVSNAQLAFIILPFIASSLSKCLWLSCCVIITLFSLLRKVFHSLSTSRRLSSESLLWILPLFIPRQCSWEERNYFLLASLWCLVRWERPEGWCNSVRSQWKQETGSGVGVLFGCVRGYRLAVLYLPLYHLKYYVHSKCLTNMNYSILIATIIFNVIIQH